MRALKYTPTILTEPNHHGNRTKTTPCSRLHPSCSPCSPTGESHQNHTDFQSGESQARRTREPLLKVGVQNPPQISDDHVSRRQKDGTCAVCTRMHARALQESWAEETRQRATESPWPLSTLPTAPAGVHTLPWALAKLWAPAEAKLEHIPQESGLPERKQKGGGNRKGKEGTEGEAKNQDRKVQRQKSQENSELGQLGITLHRHHHKDVLTAGPIFVLRSRREREVKVHAGSWGLEVEQEIKEQSKCLLPCGQRG